MIHARTCYVRMLKCCLLYFLISQLTLGPVLSAKKRWFWSSKYPTQTTTGSIEASKEPEKLDSVCYEELGCFPNYPPWFSTIRPFPRPMSPQQINVRLYLYTRRDPINRYNIKLWPYISLEKTDFDPQRQYTVFITHGFASDGDAHWITDLKNAYLKKRDANVFIVDWRNGASLLNYLQVASNSRVVGAELKRFGWFLIERFGLQSVQLHLIGHSIGAHVLSYMAKSIPNVAHLTALDPAQPGFEGSPKEVRLTRDDAIFVDVVHTNSRPTIPFLGMGMMFPTGHVDFYMNGGMYQPGCAIPPFEKINITNISDLAQYSVETLTDWVSCSHGRSHQYYLESLLSTHCIFWGRYPGIVGSVLDLPVKPEALSEKLSPCSRTKCSALGLDVKQYPARGNFTIMTNGRSPYCIYK